MGREERKGGREGGERREREVERGGGRREREVERGRGGEKGR